MAHRSQPGSTLDLKYQPKPPNKQSKPASHIHSMPRSRFPKLKPPTEAKQTARSKHTPHSPADPIKLPTVPARQTIVNLLQPDLKEVMRSVEKSIQNITHLDSRTLEGTCKKILVSVDHANLELREKLLLKGLQLTEKRQEHFLKLSLVA